MTIDNFFDQHGKTLVKVEHDEFFRGVRDIILYHREETDRHYEMMAEANRLLREDNAVLDYYKGQQLVRKLSFLYKIKEEE